MSRTLLALAVAVFVLGALASATVTPLTYYVKDMDDFAYSWNTTGIPIRDDKNNFTAYNVFMRSQLWLTQAESNNNVWNHWLQIIVPDNLLPGADLAFMYIDGGSNKNFDQPPTSASQVVWRIATSTGLIGAHLTQIPNEPIVFTGNPQNDRTEDAMIAWTWSHFVNDTYEFDWLARMPMTKASIRALDTIQEFVGTLPGIPPVKRFGVAGASKRGWTTWMVGAMGDPRVAGIIPIVAPIANIVPQINEQWESYGNWSFALQDYVDCNLMGWLNLPRFTELLDIVDPLTYPEEIAAIPKYVIMATGDEFFMPDAAKFFWDQLGGQKFLSLVPNAEHSLAGSVWEVLASAQQFLMAIYYNDESSLPEYAWEISPDGQTITVTTQQTDFLVAARVWHSYNNTNRDWRLITCSQTSPSCVNLALWRKEDISATAPGVYSFTAPDCAEDNYCAFFIELEYDYDRVGTVVPMKVTSNMSIYPLTMPFEHCAQDVCECGYDCAVNYWQPDNG